MTTARMEHAMELADKCWEKAYKASPQFVERYLELAEQLLTSKPIITGDEFREYCRNNGLHRPAELHPNVWVSGVRTLKLIGWVARVGKVEPIKSHNHMPSVTLWKSTIYGGNS